VASGSGDDDAVGVGTALAFTSVAAVQFGASVAEHLFTRVGPVGTVSLRLGIAALVMLALTRPWRRSWTRADLAAAGVFGLVFTGMNTSLYLAIDRLPLATAITLEFLGPLAVSILTARGWLVRVWALPAAAGVALLGGALSGGDVIGVLCALGAAFCWAMYILVSGRIGRTGSGLAGLALAITVGAVITLPVAVALHGAALLRPSTLGIGAAIAVLSSTVPYSLDLLALRRLPTAVFGVLTSLNPGVAALAGFLVLGQTITTRSLVGVVLVMLASAGVTVTPTILRALRGPGVRTEAPPVLDEPLTAA
jgi:inner membrane transporter RhtA